MTTQSFLPKLSTLTVSCLLFLSTACTSNKTVSQAVANPKTEVTPVTSTLRLGFISTNNSKAPTGPTGWAMHQNKFLPELQQLGITEVKTLSFLNGPNLNEALVAGEVDVGIYGDTPALVGKANGIPTRLIGQEQVGMNSWLVAKKNGPRSLAELKGQKVATSKGSYLHRYLIGLLQESGLKDKVTVVHLLPSDAQAALERGDVAAIAAATGTGPLLQSKGYPVIDEATKHPNLPGTSVTVATETFLAKHPDLPQKWNQIKQAAVKDIKANSEAYYKFHAQVTGYPLDVIKASFPIEQFPEESLPAQGIQLLEGTKKFLVSQKLAKSDFNLTDWVADQKDKK
ncbi:aliphatic sulfonate ABC transporter substrate-binding protein [Hapalosiphon sp. MRB220]|nr:aliphatic sulfonate ABC transporter substrate-binding protein [Hapalosiphon sp. MRB220]